MSLSLNQTCGSFIQVFYKPLVIPLAIFNHLEIEINQLILFIKSNCILIEEEDKNVIYDRVLGHPDELGIFNNNRSCYYATCMARGVVITGRKIGDRFCQ